MVKLRCYDATGASKGEVEVDETLFDTRVRWNLLKEACLMYQANQRAGTHKVKTRGERRGTGAKPWRQKGTGRARAGSFRSPIWRKGGIVHGPSPRDYSYSMPRKALRRATDSAIFGKLKDGEVVVFEGLPVESAKTKLVAEALRRSELAGATLLIAVPEHDEILHRVTRNIPGICLKKIADINCYDILRHRNWIVTKDALEQLVESRKASAAQA